MSRKIKKNAPLVAEDSGLYQQFYSGIADVLESARHSVVRATNAVMTATYWEIGRRIVEFEQQG